MKRLFVLLYFCCCAVSGAGLFEPAAEWKITSGAEGTFNAAVFSGTAENSGAAVVRDFNGNVDFSKVKYVKMEIVPAAGTEFVPGDLRLLFFSANGKNSLGRVAVYKNNEAYFYFSVPVPSDVPRLRFYFNARGRLNGRKISFRILSISPVDKLPEVKKAAAVKSATAAEKTAFSDLVKWDNGEWRNVKDVMKKGVSVISTPENVSAYVRLNVAADGKAQFNCAEMNYSGTDMETDNFMLGLYGRKDKVFLKPANTDRGRLVFTITQFPENLTGIRLYFNQRGRFTGKAVKLVLMPLKFSQKNEKKIYKLEMPQRKMVFERTRIYPRIQSQYDLMLNYLDSAFKGTGTFYDRPLFFDRSLGETPLPIFNKLSSPKGFCKQLSVAQSFTDGLGLFGSRRTPRFLRPVKFAEEAGFKDAVLMEFTPEAYAGDFVHTKINIDAAMNNAAVLHHDGKLVLGSYSGDRKSAKWWKENLVNLRNTYPGKLLVMCEVRGTCYSMAAAYKRNGGFLLQSEVDKYKERIREYLDVADGINFSGSNHIGRIEKGFPEMIFDDKVYENIIVPLLAQVVSEKAYNGKKLLAFSAHKTYSQVRSTRANIDEQGTVGLRRSLQIALAAKPDYIVMPEWNEVNEYTHVEPVVSDARATERVVNAIRRREVADVEKIFPDLILSFRQENDLGFPIPIELLSLPDKNGKPYSAVLKLYSPDGKLLKTFPAAHFNPSEIGEAFYLEPALPYRNYRFIVPELTIVCGGKTQIIRDGLPHIRLTVPANQLHRYVKIPLRDLPDPARVDCRLSFENGIVRAAGRLESADPVVTVELMANDIPIAAVDPSDEYAPDKDGLILFSWVRQVTDNISYPSLPLTITALKGKIKTRTPHQYSWSSVGVLKHSGNTLSISVPGGGGATREALFYASKDAVLKIDCAGGTPAEVKIADVLKYGRKRHACLPGMSWRIAPVTELPEVPFPLNVKKLEFDLRAPLADRIDPVYYLRFITANGRVYRSAPAMADNKTYPLKTVTLWDEMNSRAVKADIPANLARETEYCFIPEMGDMLAPANRIVEYEAPAGGADYRCHGTPPGWVFPGAPDWAEEDGKNILRFKKGDNLLIVAPVFTRSAFDMEMEIRFDDVSEQRFLGGRESVISAVIKDGIIRSRLTGRNGTAELTADRKIVPGRWYRMRLVYDLEKYSILLDGEVVASAPLSGRLGHGWYISIGGEPLAERKLSKDAEKAFKAKKPDAGFAFSGALRYLKVK